MNKNRGIEKMIECKVEGNIIISNNERVVLAEHPQNAYYREEQGLYIVLYPYYAHNEMNQYHNLCCIDRGGNIKWIAELPSNDADSYVSIKLTDNTICANSFSSYYCIIDVDSGRILEKRLA